MGAAGALVCTRFQATTEALVDPSNAGLALAALWLESTFVIVAGFLFFIFLNAASSALTAVCSLEVFPTSVRMTGVGFATAMSRVGAAVGTFLLPMGLDRFGVEFVLLVGAGVLALGGVVSHFLAPETTNLDLATAARTACGVRWRRPTGSGPGWYGGQGGGGSRSLMKRRAKRYASPGQRAER
ncbi:MFS transporter [Streptomyces sp. NPDC019443]|uniref:MFS transporter n=1 Tax=Streptomyces sp. NPDC019443 TaxID=3365061 RepID=UPI0037B86348